MSIVSAIDVGLAKTTAAHVDIDTGRVADRRVLDTRPSRGGEALLADVAGLARGLGRSVMAIGIALPEAVDGAGRVTGAERFDWRELDLVEPFEALPAVRMVARGTAGALAEARLGAGADHPALLYVDVDQAVDAAATAAGRPLDPADDPCRALADAALAARAAGPAIAATAGTQTARQALAGEHAEAAAGEAARALAEALAGPLAASGATLVVLGGAVGLDERYRAALAAQLAVPVAAAGLGLDAPLVGCALNAV